jgi:phosphate-selective porin OprO/OprP
MRYARLLLCCIVLIPAALCGQERLLFPSAEPAGQISAFSSGLDNAATPFALPASHVVEELPEADSPESLAKRLAEVEKALKKQDKPKDVWTDVSGEKWTVKLGGHVQMDYINWPRADPGIAGAQNYFEFRRLRLTADGPGYGVFDFRLQMTLEPGSGPLNATASPDVKDAYLSMNEIPLVGRLRVGNFFVPFGLEQVTNDTFNIFLERSIPTQGIFTADREVGVAFYNCTEDKNLTWSGGCFLDSFSDTNKTRLDNNQGYRLAGRVTWLPYYDEPSNGRYLVHTGAGILYTDDQDNVVRFQARPQIRSGPVILDSGAIASGAYTTGNLEFATVIGSFTLQSEAFATSVTRGAADNVNLSGMYAHVSYFLTGETRLYERFGQHGANFGRNVPFTNFFVVPGGWGSGAWEAKARWSHLEFETLGRGQYNDLTVGFNWYWSDRVRMMFDWIHPQTTAAAQPFGGTQSDILGMRFDFNW